MTSLARLPETSLAPAHKPTSVADLEKMADQFAKSRLFPGIETREAAFALMMLCEAEGLHPASAIRRYHIIKGRPSMRADAMQAEFQRQGGRIDWRVSNARTCTAVFYHPTHAPDGVEITWTIERAKDADLFKNDIWRKFPDQMLRSRVVSEGVRMVLPGIVVGIYTPEEIEDFQPPRQRLEQAERAPAPEPDRAAERAELERTLLAPSPVRGTPSDESREKWSAWEMKLLDRWEQADPYSVNAAEKQKELANRQHRIAHAVVSAAIKADPSLESSITNSKGARIPAATWRLLHELAAGDWAWIKGATLEHLKSVLDRLVDPDVNDYGPTTVAEVVIEAAPAAPAEPDADPEDPADYEALEAAGINPDAEPAAS